MYDHKEIRKGTGIQRLTVVGDRTMARLKQLMNNILSYENIPMYSIFLHKMYFKKIFLQKKKNIFSDVVEVPHGVSEKNHGTIQC